MQYADGHAPFRCSAQGIYNGRVRRGHIVVSQPKIKEVSQDVEGIGTIDVIQEGQEERDDLLPVLTQMNVREEKCGHWEVRIPLEGDSRA